MLTKTKAQVINARKVAETVPDLKPILAGENEMSDTASRRSILAPKRETGVKNSKEVAGV